MQASELTLSLTQAQNEEGQVNINSMPVEQLQNLKKQLEGVRAQNTICSP